MYGLSAKKVKWPLKRGSHCREVETRVTVWTVPHKSGCSREVETRVNVWTVRRKKWPLYRGGISGGFTVAIINDHFFLFFPTPLLWFPAAMDIILGSQKNKRWLDIDCIVIVCDN